MRGDIFLYDGDCAFCSACARFLQRRVATDAQISAWQRSDIDGLGVTAEQCDAAVQWIAADGTRSAGPVAIADLMRSGRPWARPVGRVLGYSPVLYLAWPVYNWVSKHRDRMPGGTPTCAMPAEERSDAG